MPNSIRCRNPSPVQIRFADLADVPQIVAMERQAEFAPHWSVEQYEGLFLPDAPKRQVLVAAESETVQGFLVALCPCDEWEIESVVVEPSMRRKGLGEALLRETVSLAVAGGATALVLEARESNTPARQLYEKIGFVQEAMRKDYYQGPLEHALLYRLTLQSVDKIP